MKGAGVPGLMFRGVGRWERSWSPCIGKVGGDTQANE